MKKRMLGNLGWLVSGVLIALSFSGVSVAKFMLPPNSVGLKNLTPGLRKKVNHRGHAGPRGPKGDTGAPGYQPGEVLIPPQKPPALRFVQSVGATDIAGRSAILEADISPVGSVDGIYYQFQIATDPVDFRPEVTCPVDLADPLTVQCFGASLSSGSSAFVRQPEDLPTETLLPTDGVRHARLEVDGLDPNRRYYYRLLAVERQQHVDTIQWVGSPVASEVQTFTTADLDSPRAYGLVSPKADEMELSRSSNARLSRAPGEAGIWCIGTAGIDPARMFVQVSPADEADVGAATGAIPVVKWRVVPTACDSREAEIETAVFDTSEGTYSRSNLLPFTFVIEEGGR